MAELTYDVLRQLLKYEPETGKLFWLRRPSAMFKTEASSKRWHANFYGKEAFTAINSEGYRTGTIFERPYKAHRVIWALVYGQWPKGQIDHINGDRTDNLIANLRDVTVATNQRNAKMQTNNTSGVTGVSWARRHRKWRAGVRVGDLTLHLGHFDTIEAASAARAAANERYGFTARHGMPID